MVKKSKEVAETVKEKSVKKQPKSKFKPVAPEVKIESTVMSGQEIWDEIKTAPAVVFGMNSSVSAVVTNALTVAPPSICQLTLKAAGMLTVIEEALANVTEKSKGKKKFVIDVLSNGTVTVKSDTSL